MAGSTGYIDDDGPSISEINVTPLVDVVLVLLIVFMVTMPTIVAREALRERELDIRLPEASGALPMTAQPKEIIVNVTSEGQFVVKGQSYGNEALADLFSQAVADNPGRVSVLIRGDRNTLWDRVATVIDLCHGAGIADFRAGVAE